MLARRPELPRCVEGNAAEGKFSAASGQGASRSLEDISAMVRW